MDKAFKKITVFLSYLLIITVVFTIFVIPTYIKSERKIDFFSSNSIVEKIKNLEINMTSTIYVKNQKNEWEQYQRLHGKENRIWVSMDKIPTNVSNAFVAIEDERFYSHSGVDWKRTSAAIANKLLKFNSTEFGGSTITQQLIKNITTDNEHNSMRKIREIVRASLIDGRLSKQEILEAYLNTISLGNGICGVQVASNYYFNKSPSDLTLVESAALAAITKNPRDYNPVSGPLENKNRRNVVLKKMLELNMITEEECNEACMQELDLDDSQEDDLEVDINSYFVDTLIDQVIDDLMEKYQCSKDIASTMLYNGGYKIYSTINSDIQDEMENVYSNVKGYFAQTDKSGDHIQSAMTIMDYQGHIMGIVGGAGEKTISRGLNRATTSPRQPGSTMKPIGVYALAIENDIVNYTSTVLDKPIENYYGVGKSGPKEWYGYYKGNIKVEYALRKSSNVIPVRLLQQVGIDNSYDFLTNKLHCKYLNETDKNLASLALGGCAYGITTTESAAAYQIFGNNGVYHKPTTYYKIERQNGDVVLEYDATGTQVISPETATIMNHLLQGVVYGSEGTGGGIAGFSSNLKAYAKTGTSSESNDLWMVAGSPYYVGSVWYGFDNNGTVNNAAGAANIWKTVMKKVHTGLDKLEFKDSENVVKIGSGYYKKNDKTDNKHYDASSKQNTSASSSQTTTSSETPSSSSESSSSSSSSELSSDKNSSSESTDDSKTSSDENVSEGTKPDESSSETPSEEEKPSKPTTGDQQTTP